MGFISRVLIVNNIKLPVNASSEEAFSVTEKKLKKAAVLPKNPEYSIYKRSIDARRKNDIRLVYSVAVKGHFPDISKEKLLAMTAAFEEEESPVLSSGDEPLVARPVIVGSGPCGLFCALLIAEAGYSPIILERGGSIAQRCEITEAFKHSRCLNLDTNIQFGAGGAGTFSDGKLITRINDGMSSYVLRRFVEFGAPSEILYLGKPHIGTDILCVVVENMLKRICELGGEVRFHTRFISADFENSRIRTVTTNQGKIETGALVLAIGHSARDTYRTLISAGLPIEAKNFSVGMRIEHLTMDIDAAMYGDMSGSEVLGHAEYSLSTNTKERGVYTFCMCPGGEVVAATSEEFGVVTNGMSRHARGGLNSNSAVACSVFKEDYGGKPEDAIAFQQQIEKKAYIAGGGNYSAPIITVGDFLNGKLSREPKRIMPTYMDGKGVRLASPEEYLPGFVCSGIRSALIDFDKKIHGFACSDAVLTGAETRTSAPIRILRNNDTRLALGYENLYPAGEGAGYAGGITSAAIDGIRVAIALASKFKAYNG